MAWPSFEARRHARQFSLATVPSSSMAHCASSMAGEYSNTPTHGLVPARWPVAYLRCTYRHSGTHEFTARVLFGHTLLSLSRTTKVPVIEPLLPRRRIPAALSLRFQHDPCFPPKVPIPIGLLCCFVGPMRCTTTARDLSLSPGQASQNVNSLRREQIIPFIPV